MATILDVVAATAAGLSAFSSLAICGIANAKPCFQGLLKRSEAQPKQTRRKGALWNESVLVRLEGRTVGVRGVEFNGEVLSIAASADQPPVPAMALGACDVQVDDRRVTAVAPSVPTIELAFPNPEEAQRWCNEFKKGASAGPPQKRVQELIAHTVKVEKHITDLNTRSERIEELTTCSQKLREILKLPDEEVQRQTQVQSATSVLSSWLGANKATDEMEKRRLASELKKASSSLELAKTVNSKLKEKVVATNSTSMEVAIKWRRFANKIQAQFKEKEAMLSQPVAELVPATDGINRPNFVAVPEKATFNEDILSKDFMECMKELETSLSFYRQSNQESILDQENVSSNLSMYSNMNFYILPPDQVLSSRSLEERIRSHQLQVWENCNAVQKNIGPAFV